MTTQTEQEVWEEMTGEPHQDDPRANTPADYASELIIFVTTPDGFKAHVKLTNVPSTKATMTLRRMGERLWNEGFRPENSSRIDNAPTPATNGSAQPVAPAPTCTYCGGEMWDNRGRKKFPNEPDFRCKNKDVCGAGASIKHDGQLDWKPRQRVAG